MNDEIMSLSDDELDCAVAVAHEWTIIKRRGAAYRYKQPHILVADYHPSFNGQQLLEIMAREEISVKRRVFSEHKRDWYADIRGEHHAMGKTINEAVLRCFLMSKQGVDNG